MTDWWSTHVRGERIATLVVPEDAAPGDGSAFADRLADEGWSALVLHCANATSVAQDAAIATLLSIDASRVIDPASTSSDLDWMHRCSGVRELMVEMRRSLSDPETLLDEPAPRYVVELLTRAAQRALPVLITGNGAIAPALVAQRLQRAAIANSMLPIAWTHPAAVAAQQRLDFHPAMELAVALDAERRDRIVRALLD